MPRDNRLVLGVCSVVLFLCWSETDLSMDGSSVKGSTVWVAIQCERLNETRELKEKHEVHFGPPLFQQSIVLTLSQWAHRCELCQRQVDTRLADNAGNLDRSNCQNCGQITDSSVTASRRTESASLTKQGVLSVPQRMRRRLRSMCGPQITD